VPSRSCSWPTISIDQIASRLARFDHDAIARTKSHVDQVTLPEQSELPPGLPDA
jgi:hypothetical protein